MTIKVQARNKRQKNRRIGFNKNVKLCAPRAPSRDGKATHRAAENNWKLYLIRVQYPQCTKNSYSATKRQYPLWKWANDLNRHFSEEEIPVANKHMKRGSTSLVIRETQIKTTVRYHFTSLRAALKRKNPQNLSKCWEGCGEIRNLIHCLRAIMVQLQWKNSLVVPQ